MPKSTCQYSIEADIAFNEAGELFGDDGVLECSFSTSKAFRDRDVARYARRAKRLARDLPLMSGEFVWVTDRLSHFYYHWMCDALPRVEWAANSGNGPRRLLLPKRVIDQPFVKESLTAWPEFEIAVASGDGGSGRIERLWIAPRAAQTPQVDRDLIGAVAHRLGTEFALETKAPRKRRIYISRAAARTRRIANEAAFLPVLRKYQIEVVRMEEQSLIEQASLMAQADLLIGPHGGGLTNMLFMQAESQIAELRLRSGPPPCFENLAKALGHLWQPIHCAPDQPEIHPHASFMVVDVEALDRYLRDILT